MKKINLLPAISKKLLHVKTLRTAFIAILSIVLLTACSKELGAPESAPLDTGILTASKDIVVINSANPGDEAVKFSWTAYQNSLISYSLILSANNKSDTATIAQNAVSKSFTNSQLNTILVTKFGLPIGVAADIKVLLKAMVAINGKTDTSNIVSIKVTPAATGPAYSRLWIVGDATPNGWDINNPNEMKKDPANAFQFKFNEVLNAGEFKIPVTTGNWGADFFMPPTNHPALNNPAVKLIPGGNPDNKWQITNAGAYKILLNISTSPFIKITPFTPYNALWMVGDATPAGWNIDNPTPMVATVGNPYEFTYTGNLNAGEFKIPTATGNWGTDYFMPAVNGTGSGNSEVQFVPGGNPDNKWKITAAGNYKITINQLYETIIIQKL